MGKRHPTQRGVCPDLVCQRITQEIEKGASPQMAYKIAAEETGIPWRTTQTWYQRIHMNPEPEGGHLTTPPESRSDPAPEQDVEETVREMRPETPRPKVYRLNRDEETERLEKVIGEEFKAAFDAMLQAIQNAKALKWKTTSREAVIHHIDVLYNVATIS